MRFGSDIPSTFKYAGEQVQKLIYDSDILWQNDPIWGNWSSWSTTKIEPIEGQRQVETKIQKRYQVYDSYPFENSKIIGDCYTTGSHNCETCTRRPNGGGGCYGWWRGSWINNNGKYYCHGAYKDYRDGWGYNSIGNAVSDWLDNAPSGNTRVVENRTLYRYRVRIN